QAIPRDLWRWRIDLDRMALLDDDTRLARVDLPPPRPTQQQWPAYQNVGDARFAAAAEFLLIGGGWDHSCTIACPPGSRWAAIPWSVLRAVSSSGSRLKVGPARRVAAD
ncbi:MAG: hypothetical protein ACR2M5_08705, partial [Nakamurella sp.]